MEKTFTFLFSLCVFTGIAQSPSIVWEHSAGGANDYWVVKLSESGGLEWQKSLGGSSFDICSAICKTNDGGYALLGDSSSNNGNATDVLGGIPDFWVVAIDAAGNIVWKKRLDGNGSDIGYGIAADAQGNLIAIGESSSNDLNVSQNLGNSDIWLAKLAPSLGMESYVRPSPYVYPNPASDRLFVKLPDGMLIDQISITDLNGGKINRPSGRTTSRQMAFPVAPIASNPLRATNHSLQNSSKNNVHQNRNHPF